MLRFQGNNGYADAPQRFLIGTLPILLNGSVVMTEEQKSVKSDERLGPLSTTRHDKSAAEVCDFVRNERRVSICEAGQEAEIFYGSCHDN